MKQNTYFYFVFTFLLVLLSHTAFTQKSKFSFQKKGYTSSFSCFLQFDVNERYDDKNFEELIYSLKAFNPSYVFLDKKEKTEKRRIAVIVWDQSVDCLANDRNNPERAIKDIQKWIYPINPLVGKKLISEIVDNAPASDLQVLLQEIGVKSILRLGYQRIFDGINDTEKIINEFDKTRDKNETTLSVAGKAAIKSIDDLDDLKHYLESSLATDEIGALAKITESNIKCDEILDFLNSPIGRTLKRSSIEFARITCIQDVEDFLSYLEDYPKSRGAIHHDAAAFHLVDKYKIKGCESFINFLNEYPVLAEDFEHVFLRFCMSCLKERKISYCPKINTAYDKEEQIIEVLTEATRKFGIKEIIELTKQPPYPPFRDQVEESCFRGLSDNLVEIEAYISSFGDRISKSKLQDVTLLGIKAADRQNDDARLTSFLRQYLDDLNGDSKRIINYLSLRVMLKIANDPKTSQELRNDLHDPILIEIGSKKDLVDQYLNAYQKNAEALLSSIANTMSADVAMYIYEKIGNDPGGIIEKIFPSRIKLVSHFDWYKRIYGDSDYMKVAYEKFLPIIQSTGNKGKLIDNVHGYFTRFGYDSSICEEYIATKELQISYLEKYPNNDEICKVIIQSTFDYNAVSEICSLCGVSPSDFNISQSVIESINNALDIPIQQGIIDSDGGETTLSLSTSVNHDSNIGIYVKAKLGNFPINAKVVYEDGHEESYQILRDKPFIFLNKLPNEEFLSITFEVGGRLYGQIEFGVIAFPRLVEQSIIVDNLYNESSSIGIVRSLRTVLTGGGASDPQYQSLLLGQEVLDILEAKEDTSIYAEQFTNKLANRYKVIFNSMPTDLYAYARYLMGY